MRQMNPEKIAKDLDLSDEQKPKFKAVMEDVRKQMTDLHADTSLSQTDKRAKGKAIREATNNKMKEILTPEQYEKYLKLAPSGPRNRSGAGTPPATVPPTTDAPAKN